MDHYKIYKLLHDSVVSKFVTKKWIKVNDILSSIYSVNKNIRFRTSVFRSDLFGYSDSYTVVKSRITFKGTIDANKRKKLTCKKNDPFRLCISKINKILILLCLCITR